MVEFHYPLASGGLSNRLCEGVGSWVFSGLGVVEQFGAVFAIYQIHVVHSQIDGDLLVAGQLVRSFLFDPERRAASQSFPGLSEGPPVRPRVFEQPTIRRVSKGFGQAIVVVVGEAHHGGGAALERFLYAAQGQHSQSGDYLCYFGSQRSHC